jgi:hypothetical protein
VVVDATALSLSGIIETYMDVPSVIAQRALLAGNVIEVQGYLALEHPHSWISPNEARSAMQRESILIATEGLIDRLYAEIPPNVGGIAYYGDVKVRGEVRLSTVAPFSVELANPESFELTFTGSSKTYAFRFADPVGASNPYAEKDTDRPPLRKYKGKAKRRRHLL